MIDRNQFVEELKLREQIRKAIKIIREKKIKKAKTLFEEENRLRTVIRKLIKEEGTNVYDLLKFKNVLITSSSAKNIQNRILNEKN